MSNLFQGELKMTEEKKTMKLSEIAKSLQKDKEFLVQWGGKKQYLAVRKMATDEQGTFVQKAFKKVSEDTYEELPYQSILKQISEILSKNINAKSILMDALEKLEPADIIDLHERLQTKPKITSGRQRGSCSSLFIRGKRGKPFALQLTE